MMMKRMKHRLCCSLVNILLILLCCSFFVRAEEKELVIVLDPGHGGLQSGAERTSEQTTVSEKDLNLKIGRYLKEELEKYDHVKVYMTREDDQDVELEERTLIAKEYQADVLISLHNNAFGLNIGYDHGCTVLVSQGQYKKELGLEEQKLGCNILYELSQLGVEDQGLLLRDSENGGQYENGSTADYYAIIRNGIKHDLMSILIEHAFLDHDEDYSSFLSNDDKLHELACADARGIARYFQLKLRNTGEVLDPLNNYEEKLVHLIDQNSDHNIISTHIFYTDESENSGDWGKDEELSDSVVSDDSVVYNEVPDIEEIVREKIQSFILILETIP